ncbi:MAG: tRNA pseudouridine(38-40) synthase TruA [Anaerohalosphaeraceae bacterium]|nr:tRNA pseudouridine(38-40) synthase TruA [Anaerohalosphaeraceae bacterium]
MKNIKLTIQYDGFGYSGWQIQPDRPTIQGEIKKALASLTGQNITVNGSSRTDAGVSALGQVANIEIDSPVPTENFARALNQRLPDEISITEAVNVDSEFDAISDTKTKLYRYTIYTGNNRPVLNIRHLWHRPGKLDIEKMNIAAKKLIGKHDFKSFASAADQRQSSVRTIFQCSVKSDGDCVYIETEADGFLYNMVRNIVGTLVEVGRDRWEPEFMDKILETKDRAAAGPIAPAAGLCLMWIKY